MSASDDAPVAMNDLAERLLTPEGPAEAARHAARLETLREKIRQEMQAGASPDVYAKLQLVARSLDLSRSVMLAMTQGKRPDGPAPVDPFSGGIDR